MAGKINFPLIKQVALGRFRDLCSDWLPGGEFAGIEYRAKNPTRADAHKGSFSINTKNGLWSDFATEESGGDPIDLYAYVHNTDLKEAALTVAEICGVDPYLSGSRSSSTATSKKNSAKSPRQATSKRQTGPGDKPAPGAVVEKSNKDSPWRAILPPDPCLPPPKAHPFRGVPVMSWAYRGTKGELLGYVYRFVKSDGEKDLIPLNWCQHVETQKVKWHWKHFDAPRYLYGLDRLAAAPVDATIYLSEGEKCTDAAIPELPALVCMSWPGGCKAVEKADWTPLAGRKVVIHPDCDSSREKKPKDAADDFIPPYLPQDKQPGWIAAKKIAAILHGLACKVWIVEIPPPGTVKHGYDVEDLINDGYRGEQLAAYIKSKSWLFAPDIVEGAAEKPVSTPGSACAGGRGSGDPPPLPLVEVGLGPDDWKAGLHRRPRGGIEACMDNISMILRQHPACAGLLGFNEFGQSIEKLREAPWGSPPGQWSDKDDIALMYWIGQHCGFLVPNTGMVLTGVSHAAYQNPFHPPKQMLESLPEWDGSDRLGHFLADIIEAENTPYLSMVGRFFLLAMINRIYRPGCKFDYLPVLEGKGGIGKSTFFSVLGEPWFSDSPIDINSDESAKAIQNIWLHEIAEMHSFSKAEDSAFKGFASRTSDRLRWNYDKRYTNVPRVCLFGGSVNLDQYLKDTTGNRRVWPVRCRSVDTDLLAQMKPLLFAQALHDYRAQERFFPTRDEEAEFFHAEQDLRLITDGWEELIVRFLASEEQKLYNWYTTNDLLIHACKVDKPKITDQLCARVGRIMQRLDWSRERQTSGLRLWGYMRPFAYRAEFRRSAEFRFSNPFFD